MFAQLKDKARMQVALLQLMLLIPSLITADLTNCLTTNQSPIDPEPEVTENETSEAIAYSNASIPIMLNIDFDNISLTTDAARYMEGQGRVCYNEETLESPQDVPDGSNFTTVLFKKPYFRNFAVVEPYSFARHATKLQFNTSWKEIQGDYEKLIDSIQSEKVLNVTFLAYVLPYKKLDSKFNDPAPEVKACRYIVDNMFCRTRKTSWTLLGTTPSLSSGDVCKIPFTYQIDKYKDMWLPQGFPSLEFRKRCYRKGDEVASTINRTDSPHFKRYGCNNGLPYRLTSNEWEEHNFNFFRVGAKGKILRMAIGKSDNYNIDLTLDVTVWNDEFYQYFADMYRDKDVTFTCDGTTDKLNHVLYNLANLSITYFTSPVLPVIERGIPFYTWVFLIIVCIPGFTAFVALLMIISTRSINAFNPEIWKYWMHQKRSAQRLLDRNKLMLGEMNSKSNPDVVVENVHAL